MTSTPITTAQDMRPGAAIGPKRANRLASLSSWLLVLCVVGYPVVGLIATILNLDSQLLSVPFRGLVLLLALITLILSTQVLKWIEHNVWLVGFWFIYSMRLAWDSLSSVPGALEAFGVFVFMTAIPAIGVGIAGSSAVPENRTTWRLGLVSCLVCIMAIVTQQLGWGSDRTWDAEATGGRLVFEAVNPITLGHAGVTTLICVLCLSLDRRARSSVSQLTMATMIATGAACLLISGSRGPLLALIVAVLFFASGTGRFKHVMLLVLVLAPALLSSDSAFMERLQSAAGEDASSLERLLLLAASVDQFLENPILGSAFAERESGGYPHNILVEAAMATGLVGLLLFLSTLTVAARNAWRGLRSGRPLVGMLFVQFLVGSQFSGSLWGLAPLWATIVLLGSRVGFSKTSVASQ